MRVISAMFAPLPPSRSRFRAEPFEKSYTYLLGDRAPTPMWPDSIREARRLGDASEPHVRVVLECPGDRAVDLGERRRLGLWRVLERRAERGRHEGERRGVEREAVAPRAVGADHTARGRGERIADARSDLRAAAGARCKLWHESGREQELQPEREQVGRSSRRGIGVEQLKLAAQQVVGADVGVTLVEEPQYRLACRVSRLERGAARAK